MQIGVVSEHCSVIAKKGKFPKTKCSNTNIGSFFKHLDYYYYFSAISHKPLLTGIETPAEHLLSLSFSIIAAFLKSCKFIYLQSFQTALHFCLVNVMM